MKQVKERPECCGNRHPGSTKTLMNIIQDIQTKIKGGELYG